MQILVQIGRRSCEIIVKEKIPLSHEVVCFQMLDFDTSKSNWNIFLENYVTSEGAVSHNVLYYQQLSITRYQVRFYANNYFE